MSKYLREASENRRQLGFVLFLSPALSGCSFVAPGAFLRVSCRRGIVWVILTERVSMCVSVLEKMCESSRSWKRWFVVYICVFETGMIPIPVYDQ